MKTAKIASIRAGKQLCLVCIAILCLAGFSFSQPAVSLSPSDGPPTTKLLVSGSHFSPFAAIDIYFDTADKALAIADGSGSFSHIAIQVPASALPGQHWVSAVQRAGATGAQAPFRVNTNWAQFGFTSRHKRLNLYENVLSPATVGSIDLRWSFPTGGGALSSPAVANGVVYVGSFDNVYALNASTGAKLWSFTTGFGGVGSSPAVANGVVYVGSFDNNVYALNASTGAKLWSFTTGSAVSSSPAVANGVVYVGSDDNNVYALKASTGAKMWSFPTGSFVYSSPAVANSAVYVGSQDNNVYAFDQTGGALAPTAIRRPNPKLLRPDFNLKVSRPALTPPSNGSDD